MSNGSSEKWWQWMLKYPQLPISIIGYLFTFVSAIPTWVNLYRSAFIFRVPPDTIQIAESQNNLWSKNLDCLASPVQLVKSQGGMNIPLLSL